MNEQVDLWQSMYMKKYHELLIKQVRTYEEANMNWYEIASGILLQLPKHLHLIRKSRDNILATSRSVLEKVSKLEAQLELVIVIYVGIGCGAGWATTYEGRAAVLMGLESIAAQKWHTENKLKGLMCHEIGHLIHMKWRNEGESFEKAEEDPLFMLYSEGFAQRCEHSILEKETWHMARNKGWLSWCQRNLKWLAGQYLQRVEGRTPVNDFFGSWLNIAGKTQSGYFLGHALISELEKTCSLREIATLEAENVRKLVLRYLKSISNVAVR